MKELLFKKDPEKSTFTLFLSPPLKAGGDYVIGRITFPCVCLCVCLCVSNLGFQGFKVSRFQGFKVSRF